MFFCKVQGALSQTEKYSVKKEDFRFKYNLMCQKPFLNSLKLEFNSIPFGSIHLKPIFGVFSLSLFRN